MAGMDYSIGVPDQTGLLSEERAYLRGLTAVRQFARRYPVGALGAVVLALMIILAILAPVLAPHSALDMDIPHRLESPNSTYLFGTDSFGRDVFSRVLFGARVSLYVGFVSVGIAVVVGTIAGVASGYKGGLVDLGIQRVVDTLMGFPSLVLAMVLVVAMGASVNNVAIAISISFTPRLLRIARSSAVSIKEEDYVMAAQALGASHLRVMMRYILPNSLAPVFVLATGYLGTAIVAEASLSFLGLGVPPPHPAWGSMLQEGTQGYMETAPWLAIFPGIALSMVVFSFSFLGDALRDAFDPRLRGSRSP
jgi:peptide/nickel transport system permease protein